MYNTFRVDTCYFVWKSFVFWIITCTSIRNINTWAKTLLPIKLFHFLSVCYSRCRHSVFLVGWFNFYYLASCDWFLTQHHSCDVVLEITCDPLSFFRWFPLCWINLFSSGSKLHDTAQNERRASPLLTPDATKLLFVRIRKCRHMLP